MKILCSADIHIGRRATRLASRLNPRDFTGVAAWEDLVETALEEKVELVLIAGDVVDLDQHYYEAIGPLERGVRRLHEAGIKIWMVAGNHDVDVLPKLADTFKGDSFQLLGRGGCWESRLFERDSLPLLQIDGWSFPNRRVSRSPVPEHKQSRTPGVPRIVLVHGDLDQSTSEYAPLMQADMDRISADLWLLGHIHQPRLGTTPGGTPTLYPGSPMALDPGEAGIHGPWLVEVDGGRVGKPVQIQSSRIRYEPIELDISHLTTKDEVDIWLHSAVKEKSREILLEENATRFLSLRIRLVGSSSAHAVLPELASKFQEGWDSEVDGVPIGLDKIQCHTTPNRDLTELSTGHGPVAYLARLILELDSGGRSPETLHAVEQVRDRMNALHDRQDYRDIDDDPKPSLEQVRLTVRRAGANLLESLLRQKEEI